MMIKLKLKPMTTKSKELERTEEAMGPQHEDTNGWAEWKNYVLEGQKETNKKLDALAASVQRIEIEVSAMKIKSGVFSTIGGFVGGVVTVLGSMLTGIGKGGK
jgi:hypothetical protein